MKLTEAQFEQVWSYIDSDESGKVEINEMPNILKGYEIWRYMKEYISSLE